MAAIMCLLTAAATAQQVALLKAESRVSGFQGQTWQDWSVDVIVENIAYHKQVFVQYREEDGSVHVAQGKYIENLPNTNRELWRITEQRTLKQGGETVAEKLDVEFEIGYRVAGREYWDDNNGQKYLVLSDQGELIVPPLLVDKYSASKPQPHRQGNFFLGVLLQNLAYHKKVEVKYTLDNWQTVHWAQLRYQFGALEGRSYVQYPNKHNVEYWTVSITGGLFNNNDLRELKFVVRYEVDGKVFWDTRFDTYYSISL